MRYIRRLVEGAAAVVILAWGAAAAMGQQFAEQSDTRFPQPDPLDYTNQVAIGDIDGDGDLDICWANGGNFGSEGTNQVARIYVNNGSGVFTDESAARGAASGLFRGAEFGDIDNDGDLDIALAEDFNRKPNLLQNNGAGVFTDVSNTKLPGLTLSSTRGAFGDVDLDGDLDLYFTYAGTVNRFGSGRGVMYINNGSGTYSNGTAVRMPDQVVSEPMDAIFGDVDGDYDLDLRVGARAAGNSKLYMNNGFGIFTDGSANVPSDDNTYSYDFGDIDGDGDLDLLGANSNGAGNNQELMLRNNGSGVFTDVSSQISPNPSNDDNDSKFFDYDNDGDLDLLIAALGGGSERVYANNGTGSFTQVAGIITAIGDSSLDVKVGDLNGDGKLDIVTAQGESGSFRNRVYVNNGPADTRPPRIIRTFQAADTTNTTGPYRVMVEVLDDMTSDMNFFRDAMELRWNVNGGAEQVVNMRYSGGQVYRGTIPGQACGGVYGYYVRAVDAAGNAAIGPSLSFTVTPGASFLDINADSVSDVSDAATLAAVLVGADVNATHVMRSDLNCDGGRDGRDAGAFVALFVP